MADGGADSDEVLEKLHDLDKRVAVAETQRTQIAKEIIRLNTTIVTEFEKLVPLARYIWVERIVWGATVILLAAMFAALASTVLVK